MIDKFFTALAVAAMVIWCLLVSELFGASLAAQPDRAAGVDLALVQELEGYSMDVYLDTGGTPTVCYGSTGADVRMGQPPRTPEECWEMLKEDAEWARRAVDDLVEVDLTQNQRAALVSFVYNVGRQAFKDSTLRAKLNAGDYAGVPDEMRRWVYDNGRRIRGLENRREREVEVWNE